MKIKFYDLFDLIPDVKDIITRNAMFEIVHRYYCDPMSAKGLCPGKCTDCTASLCTIANLRKAVCPEALATWSARNEVALKQELYSAQEKTPSDVGSYFIQLEEIMTA